MFPSLNPQDIERSKMVQAGMEQFHQLHAPVMGEIEYGDVGDDVSNEERVICRECVTDWPCERMTSVLTLQALGALTAMIPTGNLSGLLGRIAGK